MLVNIISHKVCGAYVFTLLNQTPIYELYVAQFVVKNGHKEACITMRFDYVLKI